LGQASITDLNEARIIIEPDNAALAAKRATTKDIDKLAESIHMLKARVAESLSSDPANLQFHICLPESANNPVVVIMVRSLMDLIYRSVDSPDLQ